MDNSFDSDECGNDELDDSCFVIGAINVLGTDWFGEVITQEFVSFYETSIKAID